MRKPKTFRSWNPERTLLLLPSPVEWLPANHLVFFLLDMAAELDLSAIYAVYEARDPRGVKAYEPTWDLSAKEAPEHIKTNWPGSAWIVQVVTTTTTRKGKRKAACHRFITSIRTTPEALLRLIRQRWSIENEWHWARDAQLGEDAHRYANRTGAAVFYLLRSIAMNLLRLGGYHSIRHGLRELAYDIKRMLALGGVTIAGATA